MACALAACVVMGGGGIGRLQTFAWARMSVRYAVATGSVREGLAQTFDGEHPCELCRQIRFAAVWPTAPRVWFSPVATEVGGFSWLPVGRLLDAPPVPPPRLAAS